MSERSDALDLLEEIKTLCESKPLSVSIHAIGIQAAIFERINPELWEAALNDGREGMTLAVPETEN